jgi:hypothetical protein
MKSLLVKMSRQNHNGQNFMIFVIDDTPHLAPTQTAQHSTKTWHSSSLPKTHNAYHLHQ